MIEPGRTNVIPRTLLFLCIGLFIVRASAIFYGTFFQPPQTNLIVWQQPKLIDKTRKDLLSKPYLYFFYENKDQLHSITGQVFESMLFHNREVANLIKTEFIPVKIGISGDKTDLISKSIGNSFSIYRYPCIYITLPNGKQVQNTGWQSDRMFHAFLSDALLNTVSHAASEAMKGGDWALASKAYEESIRHPHMRNFSNIGEAVYWSIALRHLNNETRAKEVLETARRKNKLQQLVAGKDEWPTPCADYLLGKISREELAKQAATSGDRWGYRKALVQYVCGADLLLRGKRDEAVKDLRIAATSSTASYLDTGDFARAELRAIGEKVPEIEKADHDFQASF